MKAALGLGVCVLLLAVAPASMGGAKGDKFNPEKLVGTWKYVSAVKKGEKVDADKLKNETVTITKDMFTLKGQETFVMKYEVDATKKPVGIMFLITKAPFGEGSKANGIIELDGDNLKVCYHAEGGAAPTTFESKEGSKNHLFVLKRSK